MRRGFKYPDSWTLPGLRMHNCTLREAFEENGIARTALICPYVCG